MTGEVRNYAIINMSTGIVENVALWDGVAEWSPPEGYLAVQSDTAWMGWSYADGIFSPPPPPPVIPPTPEQILASQSAKLQGLTQLATAQKNALSARISTINDSIELEMVTPEESAELPVRQAQLVEWKKYAVLLGRVTIQAGWPGTVEWPAQPSSGMDLSTSGSAPQAS